ncbi:hypothetical protein C1646_724586, partial [Rhizophagus diaphanus]
MADCAIFFLPSRLFLYINIIFFLKKKEKKIGQFSFFFLYSFFCPTFFLQYCSCEFLFFHQTFYFLLFLFLLLTTFI